MRGIVRLDVSRKRLVRLLTARNVPVRGRLDLLRVAIARRIGLPRDAAIHLGAGKVTIKGPTSYYDYSAFIDIFIDHCYRTDYRGAVVLDVGAHRGYAGAYALLCGAKKVISVEPEASNFASLSTAASGFGSADGSWVVKKAAVTTQNGLVDLFVTSRSWSHSLMIREDLPPEHVERVPAITLASLIEESRELLDPAARLIVKLDIEGEEARVIPETSVEAWTCVNELFFEFDAKDDDGQLGYLLQYLGGAGLKPIEPPAGNVHHLCR